MADSIRYIDDQNGNHVFPVTHERAVRDSDGVTLETKLGQKQDTIPDLSMIRSGAAAGATAVQPAALDAKQDVISDLQTIRSGAALGSTSVQPADIEDMVEAEPIGSIIPPVNPSEFATTEEVSQLRQEVTDLIGGVQSFSLGTDDAKNLGISGTSITAALSSSWCGLVIELEEGRTYDFGNPWSADTQKGWTAIGITSIYPAIGGTIDTTLTQVAARSFVPTSTQKYALVTMRVSALDYTYSKTVIGRLDTLDDDVETISENLSTLDTKAEEFEIETNNKFGFSETVTLTAQDEVAMSISGSNIVSAISSAWCCLIISLKNGATYNFGNAWTSESQSGWTAIGITSIPPAIGNTVDSTLTETEAKAFVPISGQNYAIISLRTSSVPFTYTDEVLGITQEIDAVRNEVEEYGEGIKSGFSFVNYCNLFYDGTKVIASNSSYNAILFYIPKEQNSLYVKNISGIVSATVYATKPSINSTPTYSIWFAKDGDITVFNFEPHENGVYLLASIRISEAADVSTIFYALSNFATDLALGGLAGKNILCIGDSITEFADASGKNYPTYLKLLTGANVYGVGIGGTRLSRRATIDPTNTGGAYAALDIVSLSEAIKEGDFDVQMQAAEYLKTAVADDNTEQVSALESIDYSKLDYIIIMGGTNDWTGDANLGTDTDAGDATTVKGSIRKIVGNLLDRCPNVHILMAAEPVRYFQQQDREHWCDVYQNANGDTLADVISGIIESARFNHIPILDLYHDLGWNEFNFDVYFYDPNIGIDLTHPRSGFKQIASMFAKYIKYRYYQ